MRDISIERLWETFTEVLRADGGQRGARKAEQRGNSFNSLVVFGHVVVFLL